MAFKYKGRDEKDIRDRANQTGGSFENFTTTVAPRYKVKDGKNNIRILPPASSTDTEKWGKNWGIQVHIHYGIGADGNTYLCLDKMNNEDCYLCQERAEQPKPEGDEEDELKPGKRVLCYVIDRDNESEGPMQWSMPWTLERDIQNLSIDKKLGALMIDDPDEGYDIEFSRDGKGRNVKYSSIRIDRDPSAISSKVSRQEAWLDFIDEHPLPSLLVWYDNEHIEKVYRGKSTKSEDGERPSSARSADTRKPRDGDARSADRGRTDERASRKKQEKEEPRKGKGIARADVEEMERNDLIKTIDDANLDIDPDDFPKLIRLQAEVLKKLEKAGLLESEDDGGDDKNDRSERGSKNKKEKEEARLDTVDEDQLDGMDEDELKDLIKDYDLDVDPDDFPKVAKLRAKVAEALKDKDLLEENGPGQREPERGSKKGNGDERKGGSDDAKDRIQKLKDRLKEEEEEEEEEEGDAKPRPGERESSRPSRR